MDVEFLKWSIGQGGIAVAFVVLFHFYRKDVKSYTDLWREHSGVLMTVVRENTTSNVRLISLIDEIRRERREK